MATFSRYVVGWSLSFFSTMAFANCTINVSHNGEANPPFWTFAGGSDDQMLFREAAEVGYGVARCYTNFEKARIVGGNFVNDPVFCGTLDTTRNWRLSVGNPGCGPNNADTIVFWDTINGGAQINLGQFVEVDPLDSIDGAPTVPGLRSNIILHGPGPAGSTASAGAIGFDDLSNTRVSGAVRNLYIENFRGYGIFAAKTSGLSIKGVGISAISDDSFGHADGLLLGPIATPFGNECLFDLQIGGTAANEQNYFYGLAGTGIRMRDVCTGDSTNRNNKIFNNYIGQCEELDTGFGLDGCPSGTVNQGIGQYGISIQDAPNTRLGGTGANEANFIARSAAAGVLIYGAASRDTWIFGNTIGLSRTGFSRANGVGVWLENGPYQNLIGGGGVGQGNVISGNSQHGVRINAGDANSVSGNVIGLNAARTQARGNGSDGVAINGGSTNTQVANNFIGYNGGWGVYVDGGSGHTISGDVIGLRGWTNTANDNIAAPNAGGGVWINNVPGTTTVGNRIAGNTGLGVLIHGEAADGNVVRGNLIGLDNGNVRLPNSVGVLIQGGADNTLIGGSLIADRNTISGNTFEGVRIKDVGTTGTIVRGNYVGTTPTGNAAAQNAVRGVRIDTGAASTQVLNNVISGNGSDGVTLIGAGSSSLIQSNFIGIAQNGAALPNTSAGVALLAATTGAVVNSNTIAANASFGVFVADAGSNGNTISANLIGGSTPSLANGSGGITLRASAASNTLSANTIIGHSNGPGIDINGANSNTVRANRVGLTGADVVTANQIGVLIYGGATGNAVGGAVADRNFLSGNTLEGVGLADVGTSNNTVVNNYIGVDSAGTSARANTVGVVVSSGASSNTLSQNLISGNSNDGVLIQGVGTDNNQVQRNRIGLAPTGTAIIANGGNGIRLTGSANGSFIGGLPVQANTIAGNGGAGLRVDSGIDHNLLFNNIFGNGGLGIDLGNPGITPNDPLDADTGANGLLNFPVLSNVLQSGASVSMTVTHNGLPSTQHFALVHSNSSCDPSGNGEGEAFIDGASFGTNASGFASFNLMLPLPSATPIPVFTATAIVGSSSSEFSPCALNGAISANIFANSFEAPARIPDLLKSDAVVADHSGIERLSADSAQLTLVFRNQTLVTQLARSLSIVADRGVIIDLIDSRSMSCDLLGSIVCELPALAPSQQANVLIRLRTGPDALTLSVREVQAQKVELRSEFRLLPY